jgi:hypothetical protein
MHTTIERETPIMRNVVSLSFLGCLAIVPLSAQAGFLNVVNPSFETPGGLADGQSTMAGITGWTGWLPTVLNPAAGVDTTTGIAPDGNNVGAAVAWGEPATDGTISQKLTSELTLERTYTLTVDVGRMLPVPSVWLGEAPTWNGYRVTLLAGNTVIAQDNNKVAVPVGGFALSTVTYTAIARTSFTGEPLTIELAPGGTTYPSVALFDNVQISSRLNGDLNFDGVVNGLDLALLASNWLHTGAAPLAGDANGDGVVNGLDISLIASQWLRTDGAGAGASVPEPSTFMLAALSGLLLLSISVVRWAKRFGSQTL